MNPLVLHFLPSVVRGVYRVDDEFASVSDAEGFRRFLEAKVKFLPRSLAERLLRHIALDDDFERTRRRQMLPNEARPSALEVHERESEFFKSHSYFENARGSKKQWEHADNFLEIQFVRNILAPLLNNAGLRAVCPQQQIGPYFADFTLTGQSKFVFEVDGFGKFKDRHDFDSFIKRQNYLTGQGWRVLRFTYAQVMEGAEMTLKSLHSILKDDPKLRSFLTVQWHTASLKDFFGPPETPLLMDLVNDFYRVQDFLVGTALSGDCAAEPIELQEGFGHGVPFVALAISALYHFLEAVQSVMEVDFQLPRVHVSRCGGFEEWVPHLHHLVSVVDEFEGRGLILNAQSVRRCPATLPVPPVGAAGVKFRAGQTLDQIRQHLHYFASEVFGYNAGTKPFQDRVLQRLFDRQHVLGISATGSGKSFCFWLPALLTPGLTLIICPLRSLMRDQRLTLRNYGIGSAEFINADVDRLNQRRILEEAKLGYVRLLYISPERLRIKRFLAELEKMQISVPINFLAIDEAHCISEWGHDFRPSYLKLPFLREALSEENKQLQLVALTATAGELVEHDILGILKLREGDGGHVVRERVADREKFSFQIISVDDSSAKTKTYIDILTKHLPKALRHKSLASLLSAMNHRREKSLGIVFCVYADPHGKHSIWDGTAHYLYETMGVLEPGARWRNNGAQKKTWLQEAYATGKVRAFSSKPPTLCPKCHSYAYTSKPFGSREESSEEEVLDDEENTAPVIAGMKSCFHCGAEFSETDVKSPPKWGDIIKANQCDFKDSLFDILVATKGFGMGIDKSSVRFIVHTCFSSGLESWYQEVGRAGRDNERAHIVLLVDPPNAACREELGRLDVRRPRCSYRGGCPHGKDTLCDYGKQHMFITGSYPGAESDAVSALRVLDKLVVSREACCDGAVVLSASNKYLAQTELAIYRLTVLGLVEDYVITYQPNPRFEVEFLLPDVHGSRQALAQVEKIMQDRLSEHLSHFSGRRGRSIERELELRLKEYQPLEAYAAKTREFKTIGHRGPLFQTAYQHLLLLLDHTYKDVVKMRYDMLWNLHALVTEENCRRLAILPRFGDFLKPTYRCGCCDLCSPSLDFPDSRNAPPDRSSTAEKDAEWQKLLRTDSFDYEALMRLKGDFADYPTAMYRQARSVLEGSANNIPALFFAREFSPPEEYEGNAKRLLRTANQKPLPLPDVEALLLSSRAARSQLLHTLNEADTACDTPEGWKFLAREAAQSEHAREPGLAAMRECLDFMLFVEEDLSDEVEVLRSHASKLEAAFYA